MIDQEEVHTKCLSADSEDCIEALKLIRNNYLLLSDKQQVWNDLIRLTSNQDSQVRYAAASFLGSAASQVPDKQQAWNDIIRLTTHKDKDIRYEAASSLGSTFSNVPEKQQAWNDIIRLTSNQDSDVRYEAASFLGSVFSNVHEKQQAWDDLHKLVGSADVIVRQGVASSLGFAFSQIPDKQQAWDDLHRLVEDIDVNVRRGVASSLGFAFAHIPDKQQAWDDLHRLTLDQDVGVRQRTARLLGSVYPHVPNEQQLWEDLIRMAADENNDIKALANHSLGKVSIFKASQSENEEIYKKELEEAISFFEKAAQQSTYKWLNPSQFCLPFYRSFNKIIFKKQEAKEEVNKYLAEAKNAVKGSKNKEFLFEAIENLSYALKEVKNLEDLDFEAKKGELNSYRIYCDRAAEAIRNTEETAPFATMTLKKGMPILDRNLKGIIKEIQGRAKTACQVSQGTSTQEIACAISREIQKWEIGSQEEMSWQVENMIFILESSIPKIAENKSVFDKIEQIRKEKDLAKQYALMGTIISRIPHLIIKQEISGLAKEVHQIKEKVDTLTISFKPGIRQDIEISSGIEILGTGATLITTIPLQEISYMELKEDLQKIKGENIDKLSKLPKRLANKIKGYLLLKDREDIVEQLT